MKKVLSLAIATMFAFAVSAQTPSAEKHQSETQKAEKASVVKLSTPTKREEEKKSHSQASTAKEHHTHLMNGDHKAKPHSDQVKRKQARKSNRMTMQPPSESKTEKITPKVK